MINKDNIISFDFQGWPIEKMNMRDIINSIFHPETIEVNGKKYIAIAEDDQALDKFPELLEDDGMGYGVNLQYITDANVSNDKSSIIMFRESAIDHIDVYLKYKVQPLDTLTIDDKKWVLLNIITITNKLYFELAELSVNEDSISYYNDDNKLFLPVEEFKAEYHS